MSEPYSIYVKNKDKNTGYFIGQKNIDGKTIYSPQGIYELLLSLKENKSKLCICSCYDDETRSELFGQHYYYDSIVEKDLVETAKEDREFYLNKILDFDFNGLDFVEKDESIKTLLNLV